MWLIITTIKKDRVISMKKAQELVNKHAGTGDIIRDKKGEWRK